MVLMRVRYVFLKFSRPTREKVSDTRTGETHYGGILLEESTKIELLLPGKLWNNTARSLFSPLSRVRLVTFAANHVRDLIYAGHMVDKTKYVIAVLRSISNFIVLQNDHLFNYIKKIGKKTEKTNVIHGAQNLLLFVVRHWMRSRVIMTFAFPMEKTCPNGAWLENFSRQILKANRNPKEKINYISNGKKYLNNDVNLSCAD